MKKRILIWCFISFAMSMAHCRASEDSAPPFLPIHCTIDCKVVEGKTWSNLTFSNSSEFVIGVLDQNLLKTDQQKKILKTDLLLFSPFEVSCNGTNVPYKGFFAKRRPPGPDEFYRMKPHEVINARIEIGKYYDLTNTGEYTISYFAINPSFENIDLFAIQSPPIKFKKSP